MALRQRGSFRKGVARDLECTVNYRIPHSRVRESHRFSAKLKRSDNTAFFQNDALNKTEHFTRTDIGILCILTALSLFTRFFRLSKPNAVVFDESHFASFMESLMNGKVSFCPLI